MEKLWQFLLAHPTLIVLAASAAWFYGGYQYMCDGEKEGALQWESIGTLGLCAFLIGALIYRMWVGAAAALLALAIELWLINRWWRAGKLRW